MRKILVYLLFKLLKVDISVEGFKFFIKMLIEDERLIQTEECLIPENFHLFWYHKGILDTYLKILGCLSVKG